jgi:hypothetical protein
MYEMGRACFTLFRKIVMRKKTPLHVSLETWLFVRRSTDPTYREYPRTLTGIPDREPGNDPRFSRRPGTRGSPGFLPVEGQFRCISECIYT